MPIKLVLTAAITTPLISCSSNYLIYKDLEPYVLDGRIFHEQWIQEDQFKAIIASADAIDIETQLILLRGEYDFQNKPVRFTGESECYASVAGSITFLNFGEGAIIKNLVVHHSPLDGIEINGNVKISNSRILHSCDEAITIRENSKLEISNSLIKNHVNKGITMGANSELIMENTTMLGEQFIAPCGERNRLTIKSSSFDQHPLASYSQVFSGDDCVDVEIYWHTDNRLARGVKFNAIEGMNEDVDIFMIEAQ